jgi:hypothetical protein
MATKHRDVELADRLDAEDRLRKRGYEKRSCERCGGLGQIIPDIVCPHCSGEGYYWLPPTTK